MTVSADLQLAFGVRRRLVLRIDGLNYDFWQPHDIAAPTAGTDGWRAPLNVLEVDGDSSAGLDLAKQRVQLGTLEFKLRNIYSTASVKSPLTNDTNTSYLLAQLFAPGRWSTGAVAHLMRTAAENYLTPGTTSISCTCNDDFPASGTAHIGRWAFSYTGKTDASPDPYTFDVCDIGVYPAFGTDSFATSIRIDPNEEIGHTAGSAITQYPQTMMGRRVGLYVVTLQADGTWPAFSAAELLWPGVIDIDASYVSSEGCFSFSASSMLSALDNERTGGVSTVGRNLPAGEIYGFNLPAESIAITIYEYEVLANAVQVVGADTISFPADVYPTRDAVVAALKAAVQASTPGGYQTLLSLSLVDGVYTASIYVGASGSYTVEIRPGSIFSHVLHCLGLPQFIQLGAYVGDLKASQPPFESYTPLSVRDTGGYIYTTTRYAISSQGTGATARAYCLLTNAFRHADRSGSGTEPTAWPVAHSAGSIFSINGTSALRLTLANHQPDYATSDAHAGTRIGGDLCEAKTIALFDDRFDSAGGPFEALLPFMLSTGEQDGSYNGAYDKAPPELGIGVQAALVDTASFIAADNAISGEPLAARERYIVTQSEIPWMDLIQRECLLFGFFLAFSRGMFRMRRALAPDANLSTETLTADSGAQLVERPDISQNMGTVVNSWQVRPWYDPAKDELDKRSITLNDSDSIEALGATKSIKLEHPGLIPPARTNSASWITAALEQLFSQGAVRPMLGWPMQRVDVSLGSKYVTRIGIGEVVRYQNDNHPDPFGSGAMSVDALALVTDISWNYRTWTARASLAIYARGDLLSVTPWAPAATINIEAGWTGDPSYYLTLDAHTFGASATDSEDGSVFVEDDVIEVRWSHPTDPASGETLGPYTVDHYDASNNRLYLKSSPSITLTSGREYVITPAGWSSVVSSQKTGGLFQAGLTYKIDTDEAQRYG